MASPGFGNPFTDMTSSSFKELFLFLVLGVATWYIYTYIDGPDHDPFTRDIVNEKAESGALDGYFTNRPREMGAERMFRDDFRERDGTENLAVQKENTGGNARAFETPVLSPILEEPSNGTGVGRNGSDNKVMPLVPDFLTTELRPNNQLRFKEKSIIGARNGGTENTHQMTPPIIKLTTPSSIPKVPTTNDNYRQRGLPAARELEDMNLPEVLYRLSRNRGGDIPARREMHGEKLVPVERRECVNMMAKREGKDVDATGGKQDKCEENKNRSQNKNKTRLQEDPHILAAESATNGENKTTTEQKENLNVVADENRNLSKEDEEWYQYQLTK